MVNSMNVFDFYLVKSAIWLTGFALTYLFFLRNERYFQLNRIYLIVGIIASIVLPLYTWHYSVYIYSEQNSADAILDFPQPAIVKSLPGIHILWWIYAIGICLLVIRLVRQTIKVIQMLRKTGFEFKGSVKLIRTVDYIASFSFFSYVFIHSSTSEIEASEIVNHEREHIKQFHWIDLILTEILCVLQWFNPFVWVYAHLVRQNHEYLADERALQNTSNPALYKETLLNQILDVPVIRFANSFGYSLNSKRFTMMKKHTQSPFRKLKLLIALPLIALIFYSFAQPDIQTLTTSVVQSGKHSLGNEALNHNDGEYFEENTVNNQLTVFENTKNINVHYSSVIESFQDNNVQNKVMISDTVTSSKDKKLSVANYDTAAIDPQIIVKNMLTDTTKTPTSVRIGNRKEFTLTDKAYNSRTHIGYRMNIDYKIKSMTMNASGDSSVNSAVEKP